MSKHDIYQILLERQTQIEKRITKCKTKEEKLETAYQQALTKQDIIEALGVSLEAVTTGLCKLINEKQAMWLAKNEKGVKRKYCLKIEDDTMKCEHETHKEKTTYQISKELTISLCDKCKTRLLTQILIKESRNINLNEILGGIINK